MKCGKCSHETRVIETRQHAPTVIRRRRVCLNAACGHRVTTEETVLAAVSVRGQKPANEVALELAEQRRRKQVDVRRQIENDKLMRELGLNDDEGDL